MRKVRIYVWASLGLAIIAETLGYLLALPAYTAIYAAVLGWGMTLALLAMLAWRFSLRWLLTMGMIAGCLSLAPGFWTQVSPLLALISLLGWLAAWDLADFYWRMKAAGQVQDEDALLKQHLARLGATLVLGATLALGAIYLRLQISFGWLLILGILGVLSLSLVVRFVRRLD